jgi:hypothetical protein
VLQSSIHAFWKLRAKCKSRSHVLLEKTPLVRNWLKLQSKLCYHQRSVGQSVLVLGTHLRPMTRFWLFSNSCVFVDVGRPLWREELLLGLSNAFIPGSVFGETHYHILLSEIPDCPHSLGPVPQIYTPRKWIAQLDHQALWFYYCGRCDSTNVVAFSSLYVTSKQTPLTRTFRGRSSVGSYVTVSVIMQWLATVA